MNAATRLTTCLGALRSFGTVHDIVDATAAMHATHRSGFAVAAAAAVDPRHQAVLGFLTSREADLLAALQRVLSSGDGVLRCFVQNIPVDALAAAADAHVSVGEVADMVRGYRVRDAALMRAHGQLSASVDPRASALFTDLLAMINRNQARLCHALLDFG